MSLKDLVGGEVQRYAGGRFYLIERGLDNLPSRELGDYIKPRRDRLTIDRLRKVFPRLRETKKEDILIFDVETEGKGNVPIATISMARIHPNLVVQTLFARDYFEEGPMLHYFFDVWRQNTETTLVGYNSGCFDMPRIDWRAREFGLLIKGDKYTSLKDLLGENHLDIIHQLRAVTDLTDYRLPTVETTLFGYERRRDIPSSKVPDAYYEYVFGRKKEYKTIKRKGREIRSIVDGPRVSLERAERNVSRVIEHNMIDVISPIAIIIYLCSTPEERAADQEETKRDRVPF